jgi:ribulose-5-phosphate 4-epimerase/fuculose-1-phosphate aldolase
VLAAAREMLRLGLVEGTSGNVSARDGEHVVITPSALPYSEMTEDDLVTLALDGTVVAGRREPSSERLVHLAVYSARPDARAIVHTHSPHATAWSFLGERLSEVEVSEFAPSGSPEIASAAVAALGDRDAVLLGRHGVLALADSPAAALGRCASIEVRAQVAWGLLAPLARSRRPLVLGIGGGGDVVGALATAEALRLRHGARPVLGGVSWERRPIDPEPGPRGAAEIENARELGPGVLLAGPDTRVRGSGVRFAESRVAELLGEPTVLVDGTCGPRAIAAGLRAALVELGCDLAVFLDVGGDVLAHGDEPGLGSPLCDSILLAAAVHLQRGGAVPVLAAVFGMGCDGELTPEEVRARFDELDAAGGLGRPPLAMDDEVAERLEEAARVVPTEASAVAVRAYRGERGPVEIRDGRRTVELTAEAPLTTFFDPETALGSAARLAAAVLEAPDLEAANELLNDRGVRTELDYERSVTKRTHTQ